jgi:hypothetical protein
MVYVAVFTGLRISELIGLRWNDVTFDPPQLTIDERYCRGDWDAPKSEASNATIPVNVGDVSVSKLSEAACLQRDACPR